ncbi:hypothetical protein CEUSTIGMA_g469.t1 [Chlamydomonas eustigma]|uniref:Peptidase S33 tripeptidyl aminopeptidase-like C-terminal domain-containing protein n=1 Tax=Chlamydomonas eustigma TaxID=1157962 RepID=A0A250WQA2_9CHLO|nr:hypothetical protein CEUSTIGMA_g469.t1 [Chlamydomonas eustigma]|eukprot:GAX73017.1 hypothetical protein CEUSTIGMA_g469.t1 [Chlamydomonas eustigma]
MAMVPFLSLMIPLFLHLLDRSGIVYNAISCIEVQVTTSKDKDMTLYKEAIGEYARGFLFSLAWQWGSGWGLAACNTWDVQAGNNYVGPWKKNTSAPLLVVGNRFDPQCPYEDSRRVALDTCWPSTALLSVNGMGHVAIVNPNACALDYISSYLVNISLHPADVICQQDEVPFNNTIQF